MRHLGIRSSIILWNILFVFLCLAQVRCHDNETPNGEQQIVRGYPVAEEDQTVVGSLTKVWNSFGELGESLYKIRTFEDNSEGRGSKMGRMAIPLIIGFKITGAIVAAMTALKVIVIKTLAMSSIALLASAAVAAKYVYDKVQKPLYETTPYYYAPQVEEMAWDPGYDIETTHADVHTSQQNDLQGHYSAPISQTADNNGTDTYSYVPSVQDAQRKMMRGPTRYKTTIYKTTYKG